MSVLSRAALVHPVSSPYIRLDFRAAERHACALEATSQSMEPGETLSWGAVLHDISSGGIGITLCYPFRPGTCLAIEVATRTGARRRLLARVRHAHDLRDGMWRLGCTFIEPLPEHEVEQFV